MAAGGSAAAVAGVIVVVMLAHSHAWGEGCGNPLAPGVRGPGAHTRAASAANRNGGGGTGEPLT